MKHDPEPASKKSAALFLIKTAMEAIKAPHGCQMKTEMGNGSIENLEVGVLTPVIQPGKSRSWTVR
ncbi:MAG: hypothetical protein P8Z30_16950, partial [Acidobacteriota bacterium]